MVCTTNVSQVRLLDERTMAGAATPNNAPARAHASQDDDMSMAAFVAKNPDRVFPVPGSRAWQNLHAPTAPAEHDWETSGTRWEYVPPRPSFTIYGAENNILKHVSPKNIFYVFLQPATAAQHPWVREQSFLAAAHIICAHNGWQGPMEFFLRPPAPASAWNPNGEPDYSRTMSTVCGFSKNQLHTRQLWPGLTRLSVAKQL